MKKPIQQMRLCFYKIWSESTLLVNYFIVVHFDAVTVQFPEELLEVCNVPLGFFLYLLSDDISSKSNETILKGKQNACTAD